MSERLESSALPPPGGDLPAGQSGPHALLPLSAGAQRRLLREVRNLQAIQRFGALVLGAVGGGVIWDRLGYADWKLTFWDGVLVSAVGFLVVAAVVGVTNVAVSLAAPPLRGRPVAEALAQAVQQAIGRLVLGLAGAALLGALFGAIAWPVTALITGQEAVKFAFLGWLFGAYAARRVLGRFQYVGLEEPEQV
jgi:hypothetical protein